MSRTFVLFYNQPFRGLNNKVEYKYETTELYIPSNEKLSGTKQTFLEKFLGLGSVVDYGTVHYRQALWWIPKHAMQKVDFHSKTSQ